MKKKQTVSHGFSLVELLIVIAIIGLLATVIIANVSSGRTKAQAAKILSDFQSIETALTLMALNHNVTKWWTDNDNPPCNNNPGGNPNYAPVIPGNNTLPCASSPDIQYLIDNSTPDGLAKYLSQAPVPPVGGAYQYDRDNNDVFDPDGDNCSPDNDWEVAYGASVTLWGMQVYPEIFDIIDQSIDGGNEPNPKLCGKILYYQSSGDGSPRACVGGTDNCNILYMLSANGKF